MDLNDYSLVILKPDFQSLCLQSLLEKLLSEKGLKVIKIFSVLLDLDAVKKLYQWETITYPKELQDYLCSEEMSIWIIQGQNAIIHVLEIKKILRAQYSLDQLHTLIHCPDTTVDFIREFTLLCHLTGETMKTNNQIEVIIFAKTQNGIRYLMLKRNAKKGNFWQPITGNVEIGETFTQAAIRELAEETGIKKYIQLFDTEYSFEFFDDNRQQLEKVFAAEVLPDTKITLSEEHTEFQWVNLDDGLTKFLKYAGNKEALKRLARILGDTNGGKNG